MSLFQNSVLNKYLKALDNEKIERAYELFSAHFHNPVIQENIRSSKEEQYQGEFLIDLFVNALGYVKNPTPDFNLTTELKNIKGSKKTDGAIIDGKKALAVIELKGTGTADLSKVETQAFGYKNNQPGCNYVITSNFEKLRFYIDNAVDFEEFNLFQLTKERFEVLWLCLSADYLLKEIPKKIKNESLTQEENITRQLYKDYALFRNEIFNSIHSENPQYDKLILFKKTQKLLDRFLFIFFAEDRLLLPPNSIRSILKQWTDLKEKYDEYFPLYERFRKYFGYMNTGHKGHQHEIFAYNGGLFAPDEVLDNIKIDDDLLYKHTLKLSNYDFESEVSVNILGHIFEHSLNDIDEIQAEIQGEVTDKSKSKRKKDGVFYTPKYITKYIVDNTVGKLCEEKKAELDLQEADYEKERKGRKKATLKKLTEKLEDYRSWLLQLTICDPACGSGAFLNQALEFLIAEHGYIDELQAKLFGDAMVMSEVENAILENNIYGVDINGESVEIAKLSLWLRTAQKGRKLTSLNNNIKTGNSLIDDPEVAGEKAFNWQQEFPEVFAKGGFDVVIGNPPYLRIQGLIDAYPALVNFYDLNFRAATGNYDIYTLFIEKSVSFINVKGIITFILPHKFLITDFGKGIRSFLLENNAVKELVHFGSELVFQDATTYTCIITLSKESKTYFDFKQVAPKDLFSDNSSSKIYFKKLTEGQWILNDGNTSLILEKLKKQPLRLNNVFDRFVQGIITGKDAVFCVKGEFNGNHLKVESLNGKVFLLEEEILKPHLRGEDVSKYKKLVNNEWLIFPYQIIGGKAELYSPSEMLEKFPNAMEYLKQFESILRQREKGKFNNENWYQFSRNQAISVLDQPKIITPEVCFGGSMTLDLNNFYHNSKCHTLLLNKNSSYSLITILPILNSKLFWFYLSNTGNVLRGGYIGVKRKVLEPFPVPLATSINPLLMGNFSNTALDVNAKLQQQVTEFLELLQSKFQIEKFSKNLQSWYILDFKGFLKELKKVKVKLSLSEEAEWMQYFNDQKQKAQYLKAEIDKTDRKIDQMVYELYGLTEEEIRIVEEAV
ncbi:Eco57I restriction-modification methylase domain-containing protein [Salegentibacter flavus]|uniref:site-specific DNA-methyltransferase (adenine-specific) n=1 Tax=Salegentibacter flavus TaxID=287099 RepID=A0A1I4XGD4_9FLAO|nr:N-6 DNA methylase [Salegentibacter flavus]SFN24967.1 TaqI-like C-terminal specificity domain-containing protein [Salegentibacter flavus]